MMSNRKMTVALFSNYLMHHQLPFCLEMVRLLGENYIFVATEEFDRERKTLGYEDMNSKYGFVLRAYESEENRRKAFEIARTYDAVMFGAAPEEYISERAKLNKLSYRYCERPLKDGRKYLLKPKKLYGMIKTDTRYIFKRVYLLCASAYAAKDMALAGAYINKAYKWGYFPQVKKYEDIGKLLLDKKPASILWAGRLLGWKHPEMAVTLAGRLKEKGYKFEINVIGNGELEAALRRMIEEKDLTDCVHMLGSMPPDRVREHMERSEIFLFTSDRSEGWGAVLNESMNSACAVIANKKIGSVPFLLRQGYNGLIYKDENEFYDLAEKCLRDRELRLTLGENAYNTIVNLWNPETAAQRIIDLSEKLLAENKFYYEEGPCSKAERI